MFDLCTVGELSLLFVLPVPHIPVVGEVLLVQNSERLLGNDAAIVALLAARLGLCSCLLATNAIARHDGQPLLDLLQKGGVDISQINAEGIITPATFFLPLLGSDERTALVETHSFYPLSGELPSSRFAYIDIYEEYLAERLLLLERWVKAGVRCFVNLSASHLKEKAVWLSTISAIDTVQMSGGGNILDAFNLGREIRQLCHAQCAIVTLGGEGAVLVSDQGEYFVPPEVIQPLRTIGAGSSFSAGFLTALFRGTTYKEAAIFASKYATTFCTLKNNPLEVVRIGEMPV